MQWYGDTVNRADRQDRQDRAGWDGVGRGHPTTQSALKAIARMCNIRVGPVAGK